MKMTVIGGGSLFVVNIAHGLDLVLPDAAAGQYEIALYDLDRDRAEHTARYCRALMDRRKLPVQFVVYADRRQALAGASHVLISIGIHQADHASHLAIQKYGYPRHSVHDGPTSIATSLEAAPIVLELATAIKETCPDALMVNLVNPTDVLADLARRIVGIRAVGLCVEVPLWLDCLAYYLGVPFEQLYAVHGGVNHEGWIKEIRLGGPAGQLVSREQILTLADHPSMHILNRGALMVYELTGMLPSSGGHYWQFSDYELPGGQQFWNVTYKERKSKVEALSKAAYASAAPLADVRSGHPISDAPFNFMSLGIKLAEWLRAVEIGRPARLAIQMLNDRGYVNNWPRDVYVEIPAHVAGTDLAGEAIGELPSAPCDLTRLASIQRKLTADFVVDGRIETARQALAATAHLAPVNKQLAFADELVRRRAELDQQLRKFLA